MLAVRRIVHGATNVLGPAKSCRGRANSPLGVEFVWTYREEGAVLSDCLVCGVSVALLFVQTTAMIGSFGLRWHTRLNPVNMLMGCVATPQAACRILPGGAMPRTR